MTHSYSTQCAGDMAARELEEHRKVCHVCRTMPFGACSVANDIISRPFQPLDAFTTRREDAFEAAIRLAITQLEQDLTISAEATLKDALKFQYGTED